MNWGEIHPEHFYTLMPNDEKVGIKAIMDGCNLIYAIQNLFKTRDKASVTARCAIKHESKSYQK